MFNELYGTVNRMTSVENPKTPAPRPEESSLWLRTSTDGLQADFAAATRNPTWDYHLVTEGVSPSNPKTVPTNQEYIAAGEYFMEGSIFSNYRPPEGPTGWPADLRVPPRLAEGHPRTEADASLPPRTLRQKIGFFAKTTVERVHKITAEYDNPSTARRVRVGIAMAATALVLGAMTSLSHQGEQPTQTETFSMTNDYSSQPSHDKSPGDVVQQEQSKEPVPGLPYYDPLFPEAAVQLDRGEGVISTLKQLGFNEAFAHKISKQPELIDALVKSGGGYKKDGEARLSMTKNQQVSPTDLQTMHRLALQLTH